MAECILLRVGGGGIDPDELTACPEDVIAGKTFGGQGSDEAQSGILVERPGSSEAVLIRAIDNKLYLLFLNGAYRYDSNGGRSDVYADFADIRPLVGYTNQNRVLEGTTILGAEGKMPDLSNKTLERDGSTAHIINIENFTIASAGYCSDVTFLSPYTGFIGNTKLVHAIYGLHPDCVKYGQVIGANPSGEGFHITGNFTGDANASAYDIRKGKTAYVKGNKIEGIMTEKNAATYTPSTVDQKIWGNQYLIGDQTIKGDPNLIAANIKKGVTLFGVTGTWEGYIAGAADLYLNGNNAVNWVRKQGLVEFQTSQIFLGYDSGFGAIVNNSPINTIGRSTLNIQLKDVGQEYTFISLRNEKTNLEIDKKRPVANSTLALNLAKLQDNAAKISLGLTANATCIIKRIWLS